MTFESVEEFDSSFNMRYVCVDIFRVYRQTSQWKFSIVRSSKLDYSELVDGLLGRLRCMTAWHGISLQEYFVALPPHRNSGANRNSEGRHGRMKISMERVSL